MFKNKKFVPGSGWCAVLILTFLAGFFPSRQSTAAELGHSLSKLGKADWYIAGRGGLTWLDGKRRTNFETGYLAGGAVGIRVTNNFRIEAESIFRKNIFRKRGTSFQATDAKMTTAMLNGLIDFPTVRKVTPFIGAGIGYAHIEVEDSRGFVVLPGINIGGETRVKDDLFVWQAIAGTSYAFTERINASLQGRYLGTDDTSYSGWGPVSDGENWSLIFGFRWDFRQ